MASTEANAINAATTGIVGNTGTSFTATSATQYNVIVGGSTTSTLSNIAPSSTSGIPLVSNGSSSNPSFTTAVVAGGGTGQTSFTSHAGIICAGSSDTGALQTVAAVASGSILTSAGTSTLPSWTSAASAGASLFLLSSQSASSTASITFTQISSTYNNYMLLISNYFPATNGTNLNIKIATSGGTQSSGYQSSVPYSAYNNSSGFYGSSPNSSTTLYTAMSNCGSSGNGFQSQGTFYFYNLYNGDGTTFMGMTGVSNNANAEVGEVPFGLQSSSNPTSIVISSSSGNLAQGTFSFYGILE